MRPVSVMDMKKRRCRGGCGVIMLIPKDADPLCGQCVKGEQKETTDNG